MKLITLCSTQEIDGYIRLSEQFDGLYDIAQIDLIQDWIGVLSELHDQILANTRGVDQPNPHSWCAYSIVRKGQTYKQRMAELERYRAMGVL